ncbi:hypothetical protein LXH13_06300 [Streptomyces spinosirectus]|jgi:hypothetical protein|uniref:hypothetical protein n=1 Tax=Streptomyces TaxID=1883 RepID=UPI001C9D7F4A|nr:MULTISPECIES: hypothetical protein [Streptomyces]MBY8341983.1 hypothetical protein [Streptomyces plumbidurans]UIR16669.1 hypothetical protein LXH13_06300 [Streptomyces spinosirectus]
MIIINPGSGPVSEATEENATGNTAVFVLDLGAKGLPVSDAVRHPEADYGDGRYAFTLAMADGRSIEIQMPGLPVERVRYLGEDGQNIWDFPRLYVDDSSWVWNYALDACEPDDEDDDR